MHIWVVRYNIVGINHVAPSVRPTTPDGDAIIPNISTVKYKMLCFGEVYNKFYFACHIKTHAVLKEKRLGESLIH